MTHTTVPLPALILSIAESGTVLVVGGTGPKELGNEGKIYQRVPKAQTRTLLRVVRKFFMAFISPR